MTPSRQDQVIQIERPAVFQPGTLTLESAKKSGVSL
jgi:hypothetical protein